MGFFSPEDRVHNCWWLLWGICGCGLSKVDVIIVSAVIGSLRDTLSKTTADVNSLLPTGHGIINAASLSPNHKCRSSPSQETPVNSEETSPNRMFPILLKPPCEFSVAEPDDEDMGLDDQIAATCFRGH